jgi:hypothetical protein
MRAVSCEVVPSLLDDMRKRELARLQATALADALTETGERIATAPRSGAGDGQRLRGLPVIGGSEGAVPGTRPGSLGHLARLDRKARRG